MPSSLEINSFEKVRPAIKPLFFSQKIAQNEPEKKIPSIQANATILSAKGLSAPIHLRAHSAFWVTEGMFVIAYSRKSFSTASWIKVSIRSE